MTEKQKIRSVKNKMQRLKRMDFDIEEASRYFHDIEKYYKLRQELFWLEFNLNHCEKCRKKL